MLASASGHLEVVKALIKAEADINLQDKFGRTALMYAKKGGYLEIVRVLQEAIIEASKAGDLKRVKDLIAAGADVNLQDKNGITALIWANVLGHLDVVKILIEAKANVDHQDKYGRTALIFASGSGHLLEVAEALSATDTNTRYQEKTYNLQTIMNESKKGHLKSVKTLITAGANPNLQEQDGMTALIWVSGMGNLEIVKVLITAGANVDHQNQDGITALMRASDAGRLRNSKDINRCRG